MYFTEVEKLEHFLGIIAPFLFVLGFIFKFRHWPGAALLMGLSMPGQQQVLSDVIREWQGIIEQTDDMVIVGIRI